MKKKLKKRVVFEEWGKWSKFKTSKIDKYLAKLRKNKDIKIHHTPYGCNPLVNKVPKEIQDFFDNNQALCLSIKLLKEQAKCIKPGHTAIQGLTIEDKWIFEMRLKRIK